MEDLLKNKDINKEENNEEKEIENIKEITDKDRDSYSYSTNKDSQYGIKK